MSGDNTIDHGRIEHSLEAICRLGCKQVREIIREIEHGESPSGTRSLNQLERQYLLRKLKEIMQVYD